MPYPFTNRKRIRGWPQMVHKLEALEQAAHAHGLNESQLHEYGYDSYELQLAPFNNLTRRNPPGWYARLYVESMFRVAETWRRALKARGEDFYLAVWLFEPRFVYSQVVAAIGARTAFYRDLFRERSPSPHFPEQFTEVAKLNKWQATWDYEQFGKDLDGLSSKEIATLRKKSALEERLGNDTIFLVPKGTVWICDMKQEVGEKA